MFFHTASKVRGNKFLSPFQKCKFDAKLICRIKKNLQLFQGKYSIYRRVFSHF